MGLESDMRSKWVWESRPIYFPKTFIDHFSYHILPPFFSFAPYGLDTKIKKNYKYQNCKPLLTSSLSCPTVPSGS